MRAIAKASSISGWSSLLMLACGGILLYLCAMASAMAGPVSKAVPTEFKSIVPVTVKPRPPVKTVVAPQSEVSPKPPKCVVVRQEIVEYSAAQMGGVSALVVDSCCCGDRSIFVPGVNFYIPAAKTSVLTERLVCSD